MPEEAANGNRVETRTVRHDGADLHVEVEGAGAPILLLHGGLGHMGTLATLRAHLVPRWRVILMDSRGMGRSSLGSRGLSYQRHEEDALAVLDALGVRSCPVVGFSDGGITAMRMAAQDDGRVSALVVIGSRWRAEHGRHLWDAFKQANRETLSDGPHASLIEDYDRLSPDQDFDRLGRASAAMWRDTGASGYPGDRVDAISVPLLIVVGDRDPIMFVEPCAELRSRVATSQLLVLPIAGHAAHAERADLFHPALDSFLDTATA